MAEGNVGCWGWDTANTEWVKVLVDATGHLQVDIVAAAALDTHCYGYDGADWQTLLVEDATDFNLRVKLYDGATGIVSALLDTLGKAVTVRGLATVAQINVYDTTAVNTRAVYTSRSIADADAGDRSQAVSLLGYNGATYDRLRVGTPADAYTTPTYALEVMSFLMGYDGGDWNMVRVDAAGHIQTDVLSSALPAGAATYGMQNQGNQYINLTRLLLDARLPSVLDTDALKVREQNWPADYPLPAAQVATLQQVTEQGTPSVHLYGYDGTNWQTLLTESNLIYNLRVRLYGGANAVNVSQSALASAYTNYRLSTSAVLYADDGTNLTRVGMLLDGADAVDNTLNTLGVASTLYGYNGATWDRLRVESSTAFNLRTGIWEGARRATVLYISASVNPDAQYGLQTRASMQVFDGTLTRQVGHLPDLDAQASTAWTVAAGSMLRGYNGASWDRLRTWGTGILKVGRAEVGLSTGGLTGDGQIKASAGNVYWVTLINHDNEHPVEAIIYDGGVMGTLKGAVACHDGWGNTIHAVFDPPIECATSIDIIFIAAGDSPYLTVAYI